MPAVTTTSSSGTVVSSNPSSSSVVQAPTTATTATPTQFSCSSVPRYCTGVKTREEAQFYLNSCGATKFDRDNDGIACEDVKQYLL